MLLYSMPLTFILNLLLMLEFTKVLAPHTALSNKLKKSFRTTNVQTPVFIVIVVLFCVTTTPNVPGSTDPPRSAMQYVLLPDAAVLPTISAHVILIGFVPSVGEPPHLATT